MGEKYSSHRIRERLAHKVADIAKCKANPTAYEKIQDKGAMLAEETKLQKQLAEITPPDTNGTQKDAIAKRLKVLKEALIKGGTDVPPIPSYRQMWEAGAGDVGQHIRWEKFWKRHTIAPNGTPVEIDSRAGQRAAVWEYKDLARTLYKEAEPDDSDVASIEMIRPRDSHTPFADVARRSYGLTQKARDNYDNVFVGPEPETHPDGRPLVHTKRKPVANPCKAKTARGRPCGHESLRGRDFCFRKGHGQQVEALPPMAAPLPDIVAIT